MQEHYADFNGRARRSEYWYFGLFNVIIVILAVILDNVLGLNFTMSTPDYGYGSTEISLGYGWIYCIAVLIHLVPSLAVSVRRLHDVGKSGFWYFIAFVPLVGGIWLLILACTDSNSGENEYGPNPKGL